MPWNPDTYNKFKTERNAPFYDLLSLIDKRSDMKVIDLGCGTGELTRILADHLYGSEVLGIDSSKEMLAKSADYVKPGLSFKLQTIEDSIKSQDRFDLVFSNAAIQWIDNHQSLMKGIISLVMENGQLAIQLPSNHDHFTHSSIRQLAGESPFKEAMNGWSRPTYVLPIEEYARILYESGLGNINVFEKVYPHVLKDADALADWTSGTTMIPYLEKLPLEFREEFTKEYRKRLRNKFNTSPVFYPFKRTLMYGTRSSPTG